MALTTAPAALLPAGFDLIARVAGTVAVPKAGDADSFVLHAPLELMARVGLLPLVAPNRRHAAMEMIAWLGEQYAAAGDPVAAPRPIDLGDPATAVDRLQRAIAEGDLDTVDAHAVALLSTVSAHEAAGLLGESLATALGAAGHAPIGLSLLAAVEPRLSPTLLRGALRSIAERPQWRVGWHLDVHGQGDPSGLYSALRAVPQLGRPGSDFIHPLMSQVERSGIGRSLLGPLLADRYDVAAALHTVTRVASWSMIHDDPGQAPYGWSHALTMPQAVLSLAGAGIRPRTALAVAATYSAGFRAAHATETLPEMLEPGSRPVASVEELATAASLHHDAHLVKYTFACLRAADDDPAFRALHLSAAVSLADWWSGH